MPNLPTYGLQYLSANSLNDGVISGRSILSMLYISIGLDKTGVPDFQVMCFIGNNRLKGKLLHVDVVFRSQLVRHNKNQAVFVKRFITFLKQLDI